MAAGETFPTQMALGVLQLQQQLNSRQVELDMMKQQREAQMFFQGQQMQQGQQRQQMDVEELKLRQQEAERRETNDIAARVQALVNDGKPVVFRRGEELPDFATLTIPGPGGEGKQPLEVTTVHNGDKIFVSPKNHPLANQETVAILDKHRKLEADIMAQQMRSDLNKTKVLETAQRAIRISEEGPVNPRFVDMARKARDEIMNRGFLAKTMAQATGKAKADDDPLDYVSPSDQEAYKNADAYFQASMHQKEGTMSFERGQVRKGIESFLDSFVGGKPAAVQPGGAPPPTAPAGDDVESLVKEARSLAAQVKSGTLAPEKRPAVQARLQELRKRLLEAQGK